MRFLFLGDMVGKTGRTAVWERLPGLIGDFKLDFVVVNGENAAGGFGITEDIFLETVNAGADVVTTGNHVWDQKEAVGFASRHDQFLRPANYPAGTPGRGANLFIARNGARVLVANVMVISGFRLRRPSSMTATRWTGSTCPSAGKSQAGSASNWKSTRRNGQ